MKRRILCRVRLFFFNTCIILMHRRYHILISSLFFCLTTSLSAQKDGVAPLVKVEWGQFAPYNQACPVIGDSHAAAGCVALAMAQSMTVYNRPSIDLDDITQIADLIHRCGESVDMNYSESSTTYIDRQQKALITTFGYDSDMVIFAREYHSFEEWQNTIIAELNAGRPVMMSAADKQYGGHAFIIDGYRYDDMDGEPEFHINWGWAGEENGYYKLDDLRTNTYNFSEQQKILIDFKPEDEIKERECYWEGICQMSATETEAGSTTKLRILLGFANRYYTTQSVTYNVYLVSSTGKQTKLNRNKVYAMNVETDQRNSPIFNIDIPTEPDTYHIEVEYRPYAGFTSYSMPLYGQTTLVVHPASCGVTPVPTAPQDAVTYNIMGQRTTGKSRGIIIQNGKKYINGSLKD